MITSLLSNPLAQWGLQHARRDRRFFAIILVFLFLFYGMAMLFVLNWMASFTSKTKILFTLFFGLSVTVNCLLLLFWAPARVASVIAKQREDGVLDMLRLTGMSGQELAIGHLLTQLSLPLILAVLTTPLVLLSLGSEVGPSGVFRTYLCLVLLTPVYCMIGALVGLAMQKSQHAGSTAVFASMFMLGAAGFALGSRVLDFRCFALLAPWGPIFSELEPDKFFTIHVLGNPVPGDLIQVVFLVILARALLAGLARRYTGEPALFFGRHGGLTMVIAVAVVSGLTFFPDPWPTIGNFWQPRYLDHSDGLAFHLILPFVALLWFAIESPVESRGLVRGMARRDADDFVPDEERLEWSRFAWPPIVYVLMAGLMLGILMFTLKEVGQAGGGRLEISPVGLLLGVVIAVSAYVVAVLTSQLVTLQLRDRHMPRLVASAALVGVWLAPVIASFIMSELGVQTEVCELARTVNPFYGIVMAAYSETSMSGLDPSALAICSGAIHIFGALGLFSLLRVTREKLSEHAATLVVLPADVQAAPGTLTRKCAQGHLYTDAWATCPHCEPAAPRVEATPPAAAAPANPADASAAQTQASERPVASETGAAEEDDPGPSPAG